MNKAKFSLGKTSQLLVLAVGLTVSSAAMADAIIYNTGNAATATVALGVKNLGQLNTRTGNIAANASATGLSSKIGGGWYDATAPGCLCEGWGVAASGVAGYANEALGTANLTDLGFASTSSTATSRVSLTSMPGLKVTHAYKPSAASDLFEAVVTITNDTAAAVTDVRYRRVMDWDIPFDEFNEYVTIRGTGTTTDLLYSSDQGFATGNPLGSRGTDIGGCGITTDFTDCGPDDHGALFDFGFGGLAVGESREFSIFYGASVNESAALASLATVSAELFSLGQESGDPTGGTPRTYIFGFAGVGGVPPIETPEPSILALIGIGLIGMVANRRRQRKA